MPSSRQCQVDSLLWKFTCWKWISTVLIHVLLLYNDKLAFILISFNHFGLSQDDLILSHLSLILVLSCFRPVELILFTLLLELVALNLNVNVAGLPLHSGGVAHALGPWWWTNNSTNLLWIKLLVNFIVSSPHRPYSEPNKCHIRVQVRKEIYRGYTKRSTKRCTKRTLQCRTIHI